MCSFGSRTQSSRRKYSRLLLKGSQRRSTYKGPLSLASRQLIKLLDRTMKYKTTSTEIHHNVCHSRRESQHHIRDSHGKIRVWIPFGNDKIDVYSGTPMKIFDFFLCALKYFQFYQ